MFRFFENLVDPYTDYEEQDVLPQKVWPFIWHFSKSFRGIYVVAGVSSLLNAAVEISMLAIMGWLVDQLTGDPTIFWQDHMWEMLGLLFFILLFRPFTQLIGICILLLGLVPNFNALVRWRAHRQVLRQSIGWFENDFAGRIAQRVMQTPNSAHEVAFQVFDAAAYAVAYAFGALIMLGDVDPRLMIPLAIWLIAYGALLGTMIKHVGPVSEAASDARSHLTGRIVDSYTNIHSVKMFAHNDKELDFAKEAIDGYYHAQKKELRLFASLEGALVFLNGLLIVSVVGWAIYLWSTGNATAGAVAAASALTLRLNAMTGWIMWALSTLFRELGVVAEGMRTIAAPIALLDAKDAEPLDLQKGEVAFQNISHHYGRGSGGLDSVSLTIRPGEKIGLVGRSGAGKSTLVKLLLRYYDAESGQITLDGQDIAQVTQDSLRASIGVVQQDSALLHRSVRDNILYGRPDASHDAMIEAAQKAQAHDFIGDLQDPKGNSGYDAQVGERGIKLSGGQRQRISLARVILKDAPILVLDEATSALDSEVEAAIQQTLYGMMEGKTVIAIAHRLSTIAAMDRIVVLDGGRIVEDGTHDALLEKSGLYASFWARQSGGFLDLEATEKRNKDQAAE